MTRIIDEDRCTNPNKAAEALGEYMARYPKAHLRDLYKLCFQDVYGPGHLIRDEASCATAIVEEIIRMESEDIRFCDYEYTEVGGCFVRVSLWLIADGRVPLDRFVRLLVESAKVEKMPLDEWRDRWRGLLSVLETLTPSPSCFDIDAAMISDLLDRGEVIVGHSSEFNKAYNPHYRIICSHLFERDLLPLLVP